MIKVAQRFSPPSIKVFYVSSGPVTLLAELHAEPCLGLRPLAAFCLGGRCTPGTSAPTATPSGSRTTCRCIRCTRRTLMPQRPARTVRRPELGERQFSDARLRTYPPRRLLVRNRDSARHYRRGG